LKQSFLVCDFITEHEPIMIPSILDRQIRQGVADFTYESNGMVFTVSKGFVGVGVGVEINRRVWGKHKKSYCNVPKQLIMYIVL
jgi:hypothetical protein